MNYKLKTLKNYLSINLNLPFLYSHPSYSQEGEDMILKKMFSGVDEGFFVDVGAHHPFRYSNTYLLYKKGWSGINIEPDERSYKSFKNTRKRDINLNLGVSKDTGSKNYYVFEDSAFNTFSKKRAELVKQKQSKLVKTVKVKVDTLENLLDENLADNKRINLLNIDVEGLEEEVISSNDWNKYKPEVIVIENVGKNDINKLILKLGYNLAAKTPMSDIYKIR